MMERGEIYSGPQTYLGPDILFKTKDMETDTGGMTVFKTLDSVIPAFAITGTHRMNGIFIASGSEFTEGKRVENMSIIDSLPNILYLLGLDIPSYMDGSVRKDIFKEDFIKGNEPNYVERTLEKTEAGFSDGKVDKENEEEIEDRLKNLGYLA